MLGIFLFFETFISNNKRIGFYSLSTVYSISSYGPSTYITMNSESITFQYEILHTFTLATLNAMCRELEIVNCDNDDAVVKDPIEVFKALDDTHQHYRTMLLRAIKRIRQVGTYAIPKWSLMDAKKLLSFCLLTVSLLRDLQSNSLLTVLLSFHCSTLN